MHFKAVIYFSLNLIKSHLKLIKFRIKLVIICFLIKNLHAPEPIDKKTMPIYIH
jgi:hypothetical protein